MYKKALKDVAQFWLFIGGCIGFVVLLIFAPVWLIVTLLVVFLGGGVSVGIYSDSVREQESASKRRTR